MDWLCCFRLALTLLMSAGATCPPKFLDTGQSQDEGLLPLEGSVDGSPVDLKDGVMAYCPEQANPLCMVNCTVGFPTMHSPRYFLNGSCFSAGGSGEGLQEIGVHSSRPEHPKYSIHFPCHAISNYTCYINGTVYAHVGVQPDAAACDTPRPPPPITPNITTPPGSDGNSTATNGTTTPSTRPHHPFAVATAGVIVGVVLVVAITAVMAIVLFIVVVYRDRFKPQVYRIVKKLCPCCTKCQLDADNVEAAIPATYDNGNHELVPGVPPPPMGGGQVNVSSVTRET